jgi:hypothetical protein
MSLTDKDLKGYIMSSKVLGKGQYGTVYKGYRYNTNENNDKIMADFVAIKKIKITNYSNKGIIILN